MTNKVQIRRSAIVITVVTVLLLVAVVFGQALPSMRIEAESGTLSGNVALNPDSTASGGNSIRFSAATPPPPTGKVRRFPGDPNPKLYDKSYWGAGIQGGGDPARHEDPTGVSLAIRRTFYQWNDATNMNSGMYGTVSDDVSSNRLPFISIKTPGWKVMGDGNYDTQIDAMLRKLDSYGKPIWLAVHHEPEGGNDDGSVDDPGGPPEWRRMQVKIRQRMDAVSTKNVAFVPVLMSYTWNPASGRTPNDWWVEDIWDAYCVDHYHDSTTGSILKTPWFNFVAWAEAKGMPFCIGEWGVRGTDTRASNDMQNFWEWTFTNNKDMVGYTYFDSGLNSPSGSWELIGEPLNKFRDILKNDTRVQRINDL